MKIIFMRDAFQVLHDLYPATQSPPDDDQLVCPSIAWVKDSFIPWALPQMPIYQGGKFDCENFAIRGHDRFNECLRNSSAPEFAGKGGTFWRVAVELSGNLNGVPPAGNRRHVTNLVIDDTLTPWFVEMQNGQICKAEDAVRDRICVPYFYGFI
jgi:hypothetical protein